VYNPSTQVAPQSLYSGVFTSGKGPFNLTHTRVRVEHHVPTFYFRLLFLTLHIDTLALEFVVGTHEVLSASTSPVTSQNETLFKVHDTSPNGGVPSRSGRQYARCVAELSQMRGTNGIDTRAHDRLSVLYSIEVDAVRIKARLSTLTKSRLR